MIATAPFRDTYAYDNSSYNDGYYRGYDDSYAARSGFVCQPGTVVRMDDGLMHRCQ